MIFDLRVLGGNLQSLLRRVGLGPAALASPENLNAASDSQAY